MNKAQFAVKVLAQYAKEQGIQPRNTTDLSPLETWLILKLYDIYHPKSEKKDE